MKIMKKIVDMTGSFHYNAAVFLVLLLLSCGLYAKDLNLAYLPNQAAKVGDDKYQLMKDFETSVKQIQALFVGDDMVKSELQTSEAGFQVYVFYNLRKTAYWHKIYVIAWDDKVYARIYK